MTVALYIIAGWIGCGALGCVIFSVAIKLRYPSAPFIIWDRTTAIAVSGTVALGPFGLIASILSAFGK